MSFLLYFPLGAALMPCGGDQCWPFPGIRSHRPQSLVILGIMVHIWYDGTMESWYFGIMVSCWHHGAIELPKSPFLSVFGFPDLAEGASLEMAIGVSSFFCFHSVSKILRPIVFVILKLGGLFPYFSVYWKLLILCLFLHQAKQGHNLMECISENRWKCAWDWGDSSNGFWESGWA